MHVKLNRINLTLKRFCEPRYLNHGANVLILSHKVQILIKKRSRSRSRKEVCHCLIK